MYICITLCFQKNEKWKSSKIEKLFAYLSARFSSSLSLVPFLLIRLKRLLVELELEPLVVVEQELELLSFLDTFILVVVVVW